MRERDYEAQQAGVFQRAARADEIRGDDGLAVAGRHGMEGAESECRQHAEENQAPSDLVLALQKLRAQKIAGYYGSWRFGLLGAEG